MNRLSNFQLTETLCALNEVAYILENKYSHVSNIYRGVLLDIDSTRDSVIKEIERREEQGTFE